MLGDAAGARRGTTIDSLLNAVWEGTDALGPYAGAFPADKVDWSKVLVADRLVVMIHARVATYGPDYDFDVACQNAVCRKAIPWSVNLLTDIPVKAFPAWALEAFSSGNRLVTDVDGVKYTFRLLTGKEERAANPRPDKLLLDALSARILEIQGVEGNDRIRAIDDFDLSTAQALIEKFDDADGGVETTLDVECPFCQSRVTVQLPFGREFYLPRKRRTKV